MTILARFASIAVMGFALLALDCGEDSNAAIRRGIGAACTKPESCMEGLTCLSFKGGYCGLTGCSTDAGCPTGSACIRHSNGANYCFLVCADKPDCNHNRPVDDEANCVANVTFVSAGTHTKACVPPSGT